ncbi:hypothetical protein [Alcanivorax sp.]|jgi:hypothetical protein|uniref:hypothetical protein n=1 Tax=Alcanivorax sp. TaxID=1872427 RepID=UPI0019B37110|nr:hypothetical protein [Alcanivorax sp.]MBD3643604.1 hypothetical protein [Alcanivorax sp.]
MADARFHIVFAGQLVKGSDPVTVKANLGKIFKMDAARVEKLFSGQPVVLKKDADQATAMKFRAVLKQAGAECELRPVADPVQPPSTPSAPAPEPSTASPDPESQQQSEQTSGDLETVGTIRTGGTGFSGAFSVAEVGADMDNSDKIAPPPAPDVSHLSMAQAGEVLGQKKEEKTPVSPDISHLSLQED